MARKSLRGNGTRRRLRLMAIGMAGAGVLGLGAAGAAEAASYRCSATGLALDGSPAPTTVANAPYAPCMEKTVAFPMVFPDESPLAFQLFYARTERSDHTVTRWVQSYAALDVIRIGTATGPHLLIEDAEAGATASCSGGRPKLETDGGFMDVHFVNPTPNDPTDDERDTFVNVGNSYDSARVPGPVPGLGDGTLELNKTESNGRDITRTAVVLTDASGMKRLEIAKAKAGVSGC